MDHLQGFTIVKPFKISENSAKIQSAFNALIEDSKIKETTVSKIEYLCAMYVKKKKVPLLIMLD